MTSLAISGVSKNDSQSTFSSAYQSALPTIRTSQALSSAVAYSDVQLSPLAQLTSTLPQLQEAAPTKYKQITGEIAASLESAARTAQSEGDSTSATRLSQLASDFANASQSGQLPRLQDLSALASL